MRAERDAPLRGHGMRFKTLARGFAAWFGILLLAIANGALREAVLIPRIGAVAGQVASGLLLSAIVLVVALATVPWVRPAGRGWGLGAFWLVLTVAFEFGLGLARHQGWDEMLRAYTFTGGNIWPLVLLVVLVAPPVASALRRRG